MQLLVIVPRTLVQCPCISSRFWANQNLLENGLQTGLWHQKVFALLLLFPSLTISGFGQLQFSVFFSAIFSNVRVSFKDETFSVIKRADRYGLLEFISSSGALAGLFLGASLLSMVELIYFFTLRTFLSHRADRRITDIRAAFVRFEPQSKPVRQPIQQTKGNPIIVFTYLPWMWKILIYGNGSLLLCDLDWCLNKRKVLELSAK